jgi:hypothetical protein
MKKLLFLASLTMLSAAMSAKLIIINGSFSGMHTGQGTIQFSCNQNSKVCAVVYIPDIGMNRVTIYNPDGTIYSSFESTSVSTNSGNQQTTVTCILP